MRMEHGVLITRTRHGFVCANGGVDASNVAPDTVTLLPEDPDASARDLRARVSALWDSAPTTRRPSSSATASAGRGAGASSTSPSASPASGRSTTCAAGPTRTAGSCTRPSSRWPTRSPRPPSSPRARRAAGPSCSSAARCCRRRRLDRRRRPDVAPATSSPDPGAPADLASTRYAPPVKIGLQIASFTWPGGARPSVRRSRDVVRTADDVGFDSIWVMDHFFQIRGVGRPEEPMLEGMTALGFTAAITKRAALGLMVGGIHYRQPALWVKAATTLDVLSGGRAWFGIGAAWNEEESRGLGFPFPPLRSASRCSRRRSGSRTPCGRASAARRRLPGHAPVAGRPLNSPQALSRPHPPIIIGGGGERKTLRLVAQYADACNVFGGPEKIRHKYEVLREHCDAVGRDYDAIEKTNLSGFDIAATDGRGTSRRPSSSTAWAAGPRPARSTPSSARRRRRPGQARAHRPRRDPPHPRPGHAQPDPVRYSPGVSRRDTIGA